MDSVAGKWGAGGGWGGASASSLSSYGRDEKILTAAAAGLGASVLAALGLWFGVAYGCSEGSDAGSPGQRIPFGEKLKRLFAAPSNGKAGTRVRLEFRYQYDGISINDSTVVTVVPDAYIPTKKTNGDEDYIRAKIASKIVSDYSIKRIDVVSNFTEEGGYSVTLHFDTSADADTLWDAKFDK